MTQNTQNIDANIRWGIVMWPPLLGSPGLSSLAPVTFRPLSPLRIYENLSLKIQL